METNMIAEERVKGGSKVERYSWGLRDKAGRISNLPKEVLHVAADYQRKRFYESKILAMARDWSWIACGVLIVGFREGKYWVVDGWHRKLAADKRSDIKLLPCLIFETDDIRCEARGFLDANTNRKPISAVDRFGALVTTANETALAINQMIQRTGRTVATFASPNTISCMSALTIWHRRKPEAMEKVFPLFMELCTGRSANHIIFNGLMWIEINLPEGESLTNGSWRSRVLQVGYEKLLDGAKRHALVKLRGGEKTWGEGMLDALNHGRRVHIKLSV